jgi:hypothetical protein
VIAHRLGDFVFTHHGAVLNQCDLKLWIVIGAPDPDSDQWSNLANNPATIITVGHADGTVRQFSYMQMPAELASQNQLRAREKLPPLPDPFTVTHGKPAVAP